MNFQFDVFVIYNTKDFEFVTRVAERLTRRRLRVWLDDTEIQPGRSTVEAISAGICNSGAIAVFIGPNDVGQWQRREVNTAIAQEVESKISIIPVLLPGVPENFIKTLPALLRDKRYIAFREGADDAKALYDLEWGITGVKPPKTEEAPTPRIEPPTPPDPANDPANEAISILAELLRTQNVTYFLGPGAAFGAVPLPLQSYQIARDLLKKLGVDGASSSELLPPVDIAGMYYSIKAGDPSLDNWMTAQVGDTSRVFPTAHERLASLLKLLADRPTPRSGGREPQLIVTTNFDLITERALLRAGLPFTRVVQHRSGQQIVVNRYGGVELNPHGTITLPPEADGGMPARVRHPPAERPRRLHPRGGARLRPPAPAG